MTFSGLQNVSAKLHPVTEGLSVKLGPFSFIFNDL
jgi:hypothetical protein